MPDALRGSWGSDASAGERQQIRMKLCSLPRSPTIHLLLCSPVPSRPRTSTSPRPGGRGTSDLDHESLFHWGSVGAHEFVVGRYQILTWIVWICIFHLSCGYCTQILFWRLYLNISKLNLLLKGTLLKGNIFTENKRGGLSRSEGREMTRSERREATALPLM